MSQPIYKSVEHHPLRTCLDSITSLSLRRAIRTEVVLGMPRHDCRFHGICKVVKSGASSAISLRGCKGEVVASWLLRPEPNYCVLLIEKDSLAPEREDYHFARTGIKVSRPLNVTGFYAGGGDKKYLLRDGEYPVWKMKDYYAIRLPLCTESLSNE